MKLFTEKHKTRNYEGVEIPVASRELDEDLKNIRCTAKLYSDSTATDAGTCVTGAGIKIKYFPLGKRKPRTLMLIAAPFQGNVGSYKALKPCLEYIQQYFPALNAYWEDGNMS